MRLDVLALAFVGCTRSQSSVEQEPAPARTAPVVQAKGAPANKTATVPAASEPNWQDILAAAESWPEISTQRQIKNTDCMAPPPMIRSTHPGQEKEEFLIYIAAGRGLKEYREGKPMPLQSTVLKRSFEPGLAGKLTAHFLMHKAASAPDGWLYATADADGKLIRSGRLADCAKCHDKKADKDYLFRKFGE